MSIGQLSLARLLYGIRQGVQVRAETLRRLRSDIRLGALRVRHLPRSHCEIERGHALELELATRVGVGGPHDACRLGFRGHLRLKMHEHRPKGHGGGGETDQRGTSKPTETTRGDLANVRKIRDALSDRPEAWGQHIESAGELTRAATDVSEAVAQLLTRLARLARGLLGLLHRGARGLRSRSRGLLGTLVAAIQLGHHQPCLLCRNAGNALELAP